MIFKKDLSTVLNSLEKTMTDLHIVAEQQGLEAGKQDALAAIANVARSVAESQQSRAIRVADKLEELLK